MIDTITITKGDLLSVVDEYLDEFKREPDYTDDLPTQMTDDMWAILERITESGWLAS